MKAVSIKPHIFGKYCYSFHIWKDAERATCTYLQLILRVKCLVSFIVEINDFLSEKECGHLIQLAMEEGLQDSVTHKQPEDSDMRGRIKIMDIDGNQKLTVSEVMMNWPFPNAENCKVGNVQIATDILLIAFIIDRISQRGLSRN